MKKIYIVILKFNGEKELTDCLGSVQLIKVPKKWQGEIIIVDNSIKSQKSKDFGDLSRVVKSQNYNLKLKIIKNKKNLGFAGGVNVGIRYALKNKAEAVLLLNQDTEVKKNFLLPLLRNPTDIVGPVIKFKREGKWVYDFGGKVNWWLGRTSHREVSSIKYQVSSIDYVSGCAMLIRRPVLEKIGLFDERYFLYFEDVDFCLRAKKAGFKVAIEPKSMIIHRIKEGRKKPLWQRWEAVKSNLIFINRWILWWRRPIAWAFWLVGGIKILIG
ncbi:MAG: glycosyltransferase family 2 protein [Microgenomates group bacterium]